MLSRRPYRATVALAGAGLFLEDLTDPTSPPVLSGA
jgi:hypothetical protein